MASRSKRPPRRNADLGKKSKGKRTRLPAEARKDAKKKAAKRKPGKAEQAKGPADFINELVDELEALGGAGTAQRLGSDARAIKIKGVISTQCRTLDAALGRGGVPTGRFTIIHGPEGGGKTTLCLHLVAETQRRKGIVLYIDKEYKLDPDYARTIGVDIDNLIISQPPHLERVYAIIKATIKKAAKWRKQGRLIGPVLIVLDSMNSAIAKARLEGKETDKHVAVEARVHSDELPKVIPMLAEEDVALVFISQYRKKIGIKFGNPNVIAGGECPKFSASVMIKIERIGKVKASGEPIGSRTKATVVKNQVAPPFQVAEFDIAWGIGIDRVSSTLESAVDAGVINKSGAFFYLGKAPKKKATAKEKEGCVMLGQGQANVIELMREDPEVMAEIEEALSVSAPKKKKKKRKKKKAD